MFDSVNLGYKSQDSAEACNSLILTTILAEEILADCQLPRGSSKCRLNCNSPPMKVTIIKSLHIPTPILSFAMT